MALAVTQFELLVSTIRFERFSLDFCLDFAHSIERTLVWKKQHPSDGERLIFLEGYIDFRNNPDAPCTRGLIAGDGGPLQVLIPKFSAVVKSAAENPLEAFVERGQLLSTVRRRSKVYYESGGTAVAKNELDRLQLASVADSYLGALCYYRYRDEFLLEVQTAKDKEETFVEVVAPAELAEALEGAHRFFRDRVIEATENYGGSSDVQR